MSLVLIRSIKMAFEFQSVPEIAFHRESRSVATRKMFQLNSDCVFLTNSPEDFHIL